MIESKSDSTREEFLVIYLLAANRLTRARSELKAGVRSVDPLAAATPRNLRASCEVLQRLAFPDMEDRY